MQVLRNFPAGQTEMGPALLPTPLSPAVGSRRNAYRLACLRLSVALRPGSIRICRPALAPVPDWCLGHQGVTRTSPAWPGGHSATKAVFLAPQAVPLAASCALPHRHRAATLRPPITFLPGLNSPFRLSPKVPTSLSSTAMSCHRVKPDPVSVPLSRQASQRGDPFSLSMSGGCAGRPSRARARASTYPLWTQLPVDKGG